MSDNDLDRLNDDMAITLLPGIILIVVYMVLGLFGNPLVMYFFGCQAKATSSYHFIVALAAFDLITCCISMPLEIVDMRNSFKFDIAVACKVLRFINFFASISSGCILVAIAVDRYRKICHPFKKQISLQMTKIIILVVCVFSLGISWPSAIFFGSHKVNVTSVPKVIVGYDCTTSRDEAFKLYITIYNIVLFVLFITAITSIVVIYCLVGRRLFNLKSFKFYAAKPKSTNTEATSQNSSDFKTSLGVLSRSSSNIIEIPDEIDDKPLATINELESTSRPSSTTSSRPNSTKSANRIYPVGALNGQASNISNEFSLPKGISNISIHFSSDLRPASGNSDYSDRSRCTRNGSATSDRSGKSVVSGKSRVSGLSEYSDSNFVPAVETREARGSVDIDKKDNKKLHAQNVDTCKYTVITLSISIAFVVSFLPYLGLMTWRTFTKDHEFHLLSNAEYCAYQIFIRSFLISSAVNPLIYGFLNTDFRAFVKKILSRCCCCCWFKQPKKNNQVELSHSK